ncbi:MAG: sphingomyelin phosphodiesterase [Myxococcota bacterium]
MKPQSRRHIPVQRRFGLPLLGALLALLVSVTAYAKSSVYVTNNTAKPLRFKITSNLPNQHWNRRHTVVAPFSRKVVFETNRDTGVTNGKTFTFTAEVTARDSKIDGKVHAQGPNNFQIKLRLKGTPTHSHMWQSHRSQAGHQAAWHDDRSKHNTSMHVAGRRWGVQYWAYYTGTDDDVEYVFREEYPKPTGFGQRLTKAWKAQHLNVLSYNIYMRPTSIFLNGQSERMKQMPQQLRGYDVVVFQEMFDDDLRAVLKAAMRKEGYRHASAPLGSDGSLPIPINGGPAPLDVLQDGGVIIFSRHPIVAQGQMNYSDCTSDDCLSAKGAVWVKINKRVGGKNNFFNVVGTHLDATSPSARFLQLKELKKFVDRQSAIKSSDPLIYAGDMNINMWERTAGGSTKTSRHFRDMLGILNAEYFTGSQIRGHLRKDITHDGPVNDLSSGTKDYFDYVLVSKGHRRVMSSSFAEVRVPRAFHEWRDVATDKARWDLSDHYAVYGSLHFEEPGLGFDPGPYDPPGSTPLYLCNATSDCPDKLVCDKSQGALPGAVPPPGSGPRVMTTTASKPRITRKGRPTARPSSSGKMSKSKPRATAAKPRKLWSGVCRIAPPR